MRKQTKRAAVLVMSLILAGTFSCEAYAQGGWQKTESGWKYEQEGSGYIKNGWKKLDGVWYYFGADSTMQTGWQYIGERWYYLNPVSDGTQGAMQTGWQRIGGKWYYLNTESDDIYGAMLTGKKNILGTEYSFDESGVWIEEIYSTKEAAEYALTGGSLVIGGPGVINSSVIGTSQVSSLTILADCPAGEIKIEGITVTGETSVCARNANKILFESCSLNGKTVIDRPSGAGDDDPATVEFAGTGSVKQLNIMDDTQVNIKGFTAMEKLQTYSSCSIYQELGYPLKRYIKEMWIMKQGIINVKAHPDKLYIEDGAMVNILHDMEYVSVSAPADIVVDGAVTVNHLYKNGSADGASLRGGGKIVNCFGSFDE